MNTVTIEMSLSLQLPTCTCKLPAVELSPIQQSNPLVLSATMGSTASPEDGRPKYGRRLIPTLVDEMAASKPDHVYASLPRDKDFSAGFDDVTSRDLARAVNRAAFWIQQEIGKSVHFDTVAYLGPSKAYRLTPRKTLIEPFEISGPQILHHCHCGIESGLQGTFSDDVSALFAVVRAESDQ